MELELHQLDRKHAGLRIGDPARQRRLLASLAEHGQQSAVWVVPCEAPGRFVLIDGYQRVAALAQLGRDTVDAVVLVLDEPEALILGHQLASAGRRSALEEAWLLEELLTGHGLGEQELADRLGRSRSWVSRRLGLVRVLPASVQQAVREGKLPAQAAMKSLVPLARANAGQCEQLVTAIAGEARPSVREIGRLYAAWRDGDAEQRARIVSHPWLWLRADEEHGRSEPADPGSRSALEAVLQDIDVMGAICRRVRRRWPHVLASQPEAEVRATVQRAWHETRLAVETVSEALEEERAHAGRGDACGDPAPAP